MKNPKFVLIAAVSLEGRITRGKREGSQWTSPEDKAWFRKELDRYNAVVMGRKTFDAIPRPLTSRNRIVFTRSSFAPQSLNGYTHSPLFCCSQEQQNRGCVIAFSGNAGRLSILLKRRGWQRVAVTGGTSIYDWFLKRNLISEMYLTLEPVIFGSGKPLCSRLFKSRRSFHLLSTKRLNSRGTLLLHYKSIKSYSNYYSSKS